MTQRDCRIIVLAAGEGTRMRSDIPKIMHRIAGQPMLSLVLHTAENAGATQIDAVIGPNMKNVAAFIVATVHGTRVHVQKERLGTAHAVLSARASLEKATDDVVVLYGDTPLLTEDTILRMRQALADGADVAVLGFHTSNPYGYGRLIVSDDNKLLAIKEHQDASPEELEIDFCNSGVMAFNGHRILDLLDQIGTDNSKGEYYLTDAVEIANEMGLRAVAVTGDETQILGVNSRRQLAEAESIMQNKLRSAALDLGVTLVAPETVFLSPDTQLAPDVVIEPNVFFGPKVIIERGATIRAFSHLEGASVGEDCVIGPYARLRPGAKIKKSARVGNFVEIKNADIMEGAKVSHLSYIGDASVGVEANIGAGTITSNYDGFLKHRTRIGNGTFIGSNSSLVAPVTIGDGAVVGSGSVITRDVEPNALAVARGEQTVKSGWAAERRARMNVIDGTD